VLSLLVVVLLTLIQVRRTMVPLQKLQEATQQIAGRRFDTLEVSSNDEFQQLAADFNQMAHDLGKQFRALETIREIDHALLSSLSSAEIVKTALHRLRGFLPYQGISVTLLGDSPAADCLTYITTDQQNSGTSAGAVPLTLEEIDELQHETLRLDSSHTLRSYLAALVAQGMKWFLVVPIRHEHRLLGILSLGNPTPPLETSDDRLYAKQVGDQLALGLSRARLIEELAKLNLGTLTALARAIDAKSEWTSGHSERVTKMAIEIGRVMGLPQEELLILHRGGLLHDIGKIGTPHQILDKPGKLTEEEFRVMREHVTTGARILEPIPGFTELIPIVLQHHEKFDGSGYPAGLAAEAISLHARIFAVADVHDALISDRPYRPGWQKERVVSFIREQAGTHFDPKVVDAFLRLMSNRSDAAPSAEDEASQTAEDPNLVGTVHTKGRAE
jgi:putative nucleotidyltransferase with HDIG domain